MKGKLCCIFNIPSLYREAIYLDIDKSYDCEWFFEKENIDIALFDTSKLRNTHLLEHCKLIGRLYRMKGLTREVLAVKDAEAYLMVGVPMCFSIWVLCLVLKLFHPKRRVYFWTHGWYGKESRFQYVVKKAFLKLADGLFLYGNHARNLLVEEGFAPDKLHVIHNSLSYDVQLALRRQLHEDDVFKSHFGNDNPVLLFIGRLTTVKRLDLLLETVSILRNEGKVFNLVFVGDGVEKERLLKRAKDFGISGQTWFYGACYDEKTNAQLIYNADLCVAPGNIGLTAIHVLMFGCPAVTHSDMAYQMPEAEAIKPGQTGAFFERGNAQSLAEAVSDWFNENGNDRERVRQACYSEIDDNWTPEFQMNVLRTVLK